MRFPTFTIYLYHRSIWCEGIKMNILEYIDIELKWKSNIPKFKFKIKEEKKITTEFPLKCMYKNKRISKTGEAYYTHYLGEIVGKEIYKQRKKLFSLYSLIPFYIKNFDGYKEKLLVYLNTLHTNNSQGLIKMYSSEIGDIVRKRQSDWGNVHANQISKQNIELWKTDEYVKKTMGTRDYSYENHGKKVSEFYKNPENSEFIHNIMNAPNRVSKISKAAKNMWNNAKTNNSNLFYKMINSSKNKNFELNGYKLNSIEYLVGKILNDFDIKWEHNKLFNFKISCYLPDFYVESKKIIIECYGDFWHANPKFFGNDGYTHKNRTVKQVREYDYKKKLTFEENGYTYLYFWEDDIINTLDKIKEQINEYNTK